MNRPLPTPGSAPGLVLATALLATAGMAPRLGAYPLDAADTLGIRRLTGYATSQAAKTGSKLPPGALLGRADIMLSLQSAPGLDLTTLAKDPVLQKALEETLAKRDPSYAIALVDITDPQRIAWAGLREDRSQLPGSVGKVGCMIALFDGLARAFPEPEQRERILRDRVIEATDWAVGDRHTVPILDPASGRNRHRVVKAGDRFSLYEWLDHMISASANSAGSTIWKEAMLLRKFGTTYPPSAEDEARFFRDTPKKELSRLSLQVIEDPLAAAGVATGFRQGTMFTGAGQRYVPGVPSAATPLALVRILLRIEQGRLVDAWSSLEMKRLLYITKRRYRYCFAPELSGSAVYFKSGSIYGCKPEPGFSCGQFRGNRMNLMNSVAIVESPAVRGQDQKRYLVALMSNVLKVNSAWDHSRIAAALDQAVRTRAAAAIQDQGSAAEVKASGGGEDHDDQ